MSEVRGETVILLFCTLPVDLDIFSPLRTRWPLQRMLWGHLDGSFSQMAVWLYSAKLRWLLIRSLPEACR